MLFKISYRCTSILVQDHRILNSMIMKNKYLLSFISKLVLQLYSAKCLTKLDVCWSFNNMQIKADNE